MPDPDATLPGELDATALDPAGVAIAVAFTGALLAGIGGVAWLFGPDAVAALGSGLLAVGLLIVGAAPALWIALRRGHLRLPGV